jgi:cyclase
MAMNEIAHNVYVEDAYEGGNVGAIMSARGAVLVDTPMLPPDARAWRQTLVEHGAVAIYGIVNTDYHLERMLGNAQFAPVRTWGHEAAAKPIAKYNATTIEQLLGAYRTRASSLTEELAGMEAALPELSVDDRVTLHLGDRLVEILFLEGHTPGSLGVYLPEERILFAGDNITCDEEPVMSQANTLAWIRTLQRIGGMSVDVIVPGTGESCGKEALTPMIEHISEMRAKVEVMFRRGSSRREVVEKVEIEERFPVPDEQSARLKRRRRENLERVYTEIRLQDRRA